MKTLSNRERSKRSEKQLAKQLGGRVQPASGSLPVKRLKLDVVTKHFAIDDKVTFFKGFSVKLEDWRKVRKQAWKMNRKPAMSINFGGINSYTLKDESVRLFIISEEDFMLLSTLIGEL